MTDREQQEARSAHGVPLTKIEFARLWRERMGGSRFNDEHWEAKLITERAHGIGVKLVGGGEGV